MNKTEMSGNTYEIKSGMFKGRASNCGMGNMKSRKIRILVIEDDKALAMTMMFALTHAGCDVDAVHTGKRGLELSQEKQFDLIALDIDLPDSNGYQVCREIKQRHFSRRTPIIFISGRLLEEDIRRGLEAGAVDYITKPFGLEFAPRLLSHIRRIETVA